MTDLSDPGTWEWQAAIAFRPVREVAYAFTEAAGQATLSDIPALCRQLQAAVDAARLWLGEHLCPVPRLGAFRLAQLDAMERLAVVAPSSPTEESAESVIVGTADQIAELEAAINELRTWKVGTDD
jgi:hypothetical protein